MMNHIFVSYSRQDEKTVDSFVALMRKENINIWQDKSGAGSGIPFSTKWFDVIVEALYTAEGAIIFHSGSWDRSVPCSKEMGIMKKCCMPVLWLEIEDINRSSEEALQQVRDFIIDEVDTKRNHTRTNLISNSYSFKIGVDPYQLIKYSKAFAVREHIHYLFVQLKRMSSLAKEMDFEHSDPDLYPAIQAYLRFAKGMTKRQLAGAAVGLAASFAMMIYLASAAIAMPKSKEQMQKAYDGMAQAGVIEQMVGIDPLTATEKMIQYDKGNITSESFFTLNNNSISIETAILPKRVKMNSDDKDIKSFGINEVRKESDHFSLGLSKTVGSLTITDKSTGLSYTLNTSGAVDGYTWNEDGSELMYWTGNRLFLYDAEKTGYPIELSEIFQKITGAGFSREKGSSELAAYTEGGTLIVWDDPLPKQEMHRRGIGYGEFIDNYGDPAVVYIDGKDIVINIANNEKSIQPEIAGKIMPEYYSVSHDSSKIAFMYQSEKQKIAIVDTETGKVLLDTETPYKPTAVLFGPDDKSLYAVGYGGGLMKIDTDSGKVICSDDTLHYHNLTCFGDSIVTSDFYGNISIYDQHLKLKNDFYITGRYFYGVPFKSLAVAEEKGYLFTVNRGGGETKGCARYDLNTGEHDLFQRSVKNQVAANSAVAVSDNEEFVAFGYPDGSISIYETEHMYLAGELNGAGEYVAALYFSNNGEKLYALGQSGTIYCWELRERKTTDNLSSMQENWGMLQQRYLSYAKKYYESIQE